MKPEDLPVVLPLTVPHYLRIMDRADATGRTQFESNLTIILESSRPGGWLRPRIYYNPIRRYRNRRRWVDLVTERAGVMFLAGWTASERYHGIETERRGR